MLGAGAWNWRFTWSCGHAAALSCSVVRIGLPRDHALETEVDHQALDRAARDHDALAFELPPDLPRPVDFEVLGEDPFDLWLHAKSRFARTDSFEGSTLLATWSW